MYHPAPYGKESDLCSMLRQLAPMFEHRIFLLQLLIMVILVLLLDYWNS